MPTPDPVPPVAEPTVIFVINRAWSPEADLQATYDATRMYWRVGADTRARAVYALGVAGGVVRGAYLIQSWHPAGEEGRWGFEGVPAPALGVVGTSVDRLAPPRGAANPVRRYLDGIPPTEEKPVLTIARELNAEPLARIMYGQRELFHSNFLAWFQISGETVAHPAKPGQISGETVAHLRETVIWLALFSTSLAPPANPSDRRRGQGTFDP